MAAIFITRSSSSERSAGDWTRFRSPATSCSDAFRNAVPLPSGVVRVYQSDSRGGTQFVGEDRIQHTPTDETLNLKIGNAFDVVAERKQVDFEKITSNVYEMEYEIVLRNHKAIPVSIEVNEPIGGTWRMLRSSHQWTKSDAWAAQFAVPVAANGTATLQYRVRVTY